MTKRGHRAAVWISLGVLVLLLTSGHLALRADTNDSVAAGKGKFLENCAACHLFAHRVGPSLPIDVGYFVRAAVPVPVVTGLLTHAVRNRPPESHMPTFSTADLSDADVANIAAYLYSLTPLPATPPTMGNAENGHALYGLACFMCHGEQGEGRGHAPALAAQANSFKAMNAPPNTMLAFVTLATRSGTLPHMPTFPPAKLTDAQLADIAAYIWSLPPPPAQAAAPPEGKR